MTELPQFKGYTIDYRPGEFRRMQLGPDGVVEFIPFDSAAGQQLLQEHITQLIADLADTDLAQDPAGVRHKANDLTRAYRAYQVQGVLS